VRFEEAVPEGVGFGELPMSAPRLARISVNECDPLRDEGIGFYRLLLDSGVPARCRQMMGACHGIEIMPTICPTSPAPPPATSPPSCPASNSSDG
jgi:acetyl esterase/lipase